MKLQVTFKTPDAVEEAINDRWDFEDRPAMDDIDSVVKEFVEYGEQVTIEFDTDTQTATVVRIGDPT